MKTYAFYLAVIIFVTATLGIPTFADSFSFNQTSDTQTLIGFNITTGSGDSSDTFTVTNSTGTTWTDYSIVVGGPSGETSPDEAFFTSFSGPGTAVASAVTAPFTSGPNGAMFPNEFEINGISIASGAAYTFTVGIGAGEPGWAVYGTPSTGTGTGTGGTPPVPEPGTMLLLGSGLISIAGLRRKFNK